VAQPATAATASPQPKNSEVERMTLRYTARAPRSHRQAAPVRGSGFVALIPASQSRTPDFMKMLSPMAWSFSGLLVLALAACGNEPAATTPPQPSEAPAASSGTPAAEPAAADPPKAEAKPEAKDAKAKAEAKLQSSGRPAVLKTDPNEITDTFGSSPPSKLELGSGEIATLRLPEGGLHTGTLVTFKIERSGKSAGGQLGKVYSIKSVIPPSAEPEQITSDGPPFVIELPGARKDVNLAVGVEDDKGKIKWTVVAAKSVDEGRKVAIFELPTLPSGFLHLTTKAPTGGK
jgi:hypothetical protein